MIAYIDKIYKESFSKFNYFCWIAKSIVHLVGKSAKLVGQRRLLELEHNVQLNTTCTTIINEDLNWTNFVDIFNLINISVSTHEYGLHKFFKSTHFLFSWSKHRKDKGVPLVGPNCIPLSFWRLVP
jgi:hypothetical protein